MKPATTGIVLGVIGIVGLVVVYSLRPPSGFGDALMMMAQGKEFFISEPYYQLLLGACVVLTGFGAVKLLKG